MCTVAGVISLNLQAETHIAASQGLIWRTKGLTKCSRNNVAWLVSGFNIINASFCDV